MKKIAHFFLILVLLASLGWVVWRGFTGQPGRESEKEQDAASVPAAPGIRDEGGSEEDSPKVSLTKEQVESFHIATAPLTPCERVPELRALGQVLDPSPLITMDSDLSAAEAALLASQAEFERTQSLFSGGELTSRKALETAQASFRADEIKVTALRNQARLQWGEMLPLEKRSEFIESIVTGDNAMVRVDLMVGDALPEKPTSATLFLAGRETGPIAVQAIFPALSSDALTQGQGYLLLAPNTGRSLVPGVAVTAQLAFGGKTRSGYVIPRSAILRHDGRTWVFIQDETPTEFVRTAVAIDTPDESGWFVPAEAGGLKGDEHIVISSPQLLLSEEMKQAGGTGEED